MNPALIALLMALAPEAETFDTEQVVTPTGEYVSGIEAGGVWGEDVDGPDVDGYRLGFVAISREEGSWMGHAGTFYVEWSESRDQEILEGGLELSYPYIQKSRVGFGPRFRFALQERAEPPHRGTDAVFGVGVELGVWVTRKVQFVAAADRSFGFEAGTRDTYGANLRIMLWKDRDKKRQTEAGENGDK